MSPMRDDEQRTREDRATQPMDCWRLSLAKKIQVAMLHFLVHPVYIESVLLQLTKRRARAAKLSGYHVACSVLLAQEE